MIERKLPEGWFYDLDIEAYRQVIGTLPQGTTIVELGVWQGRSICSVADLIIQNNLHVVLVDTFEGTAGEEEEHKEAKTKDLESILRTNLNEFGIIQNCTIRRCRTDDKELLEYYKNARDISMVFVDADHSEQAVMLDIVNWTPMLNPQYGILMGHDIHWVDPKTNQTNIKNALEKLGLLQGIQTKGNVWMIPYTEIIKTYSSELENKKLSKKATIVPLQNNTILKDNIEYSATYKNPLDNRVNCVVCTRGREFRTLPLTLMSILQQTVKPDFLNIYDDNDRVNLLAEPMYDHIFNLLERSGIKWQFHQSQDKGQVYNHQKAFNESPCDLIWRVDDDVIPRSNCLEVLKRLISDRQVAAVGPLIITKGFEEKFPIRTCSSRLIDIDSHPNQQMAARSSVNKEASWEGGVEHLHCSFIFDKTKFGEGYPKGLSRVGHREETIFTMQAFFNGHKLMITGMTDCYHLKDDKGGIRDGQEEMFENDQKVYEAYLLNNCPKILREHVGIQTVRKGNAEKEDYSKSSVVIDVMKEEKVIKDAFIYLDNGVGDHIAFMNSGVLDRCIGNIKVACCFPGVFTSRPEYVGIEILSLEQGLIQMALKGNNPNQYSVYAYMSKNNCHIVEAFKRMYDELWL